MLHAFGLDLPVMWLAIGLSLLIVLGGLLWLRHALRTAPRAEDL